MDLTVKIKKLRSDAVIPKYATEGSAACDLCYAGDAPVTIAPGKTEMIPTGLSVSFPAGNAAFIYARSGLASKCGIAPANCVGVIDSDYRGEIKIALHNSSDKLFTVNPGDRTAQLLFAPVLNAAFDEIGELDTTDRADGGFGSTGVR